LSWEENYDRINFKFKYLLPYSDSEMLLLITVMIFNIAVFILSYKYDGDILSLIWFVATSLVTSIFAFKFILLTNYDFEIFKKESEYNLIGSNQSSYLNSYIEDTSLNRKDRKNRKNRRDIFFVAWLGDKKIDKDTLDRAIYFDISYRYLEYLKNYKPHQYIFGYIIRIFISTALAFHGLMVLLTNIYLGNSNQNILFFFALSYIIYIAYITYLPYIEIEQKIFFGSYLRGIKYKYFLVDDNLDREEEERSSRYTDVISIVFGVLFVLYVTLAYDAIYTADINVKYVFGEEYNSSRSFYDIIHQKSLMYGEREDMGIK